MASLANLSYYGQNPESWRLACQTIVGNKENSGKVLSKTIYSSLVATVHVFQLKCYIYDAQNIQISVSIFTSIGTALKWVWCQFLSFIL